LCAGPDAIVHATQSLAIFGTLGANLRAFAADMLVMGRVQQHEVCGGPANFGAGHHKPEVLGLDMFSAGLEAMRHG